jgi:hypothetical protein
MSSQPPEPTPAELSAALRNVAVKKPNVAKIRTATKRTVRGKVDDTTTLVIKVEVNLVPPVTSVVAPAAVAVQMPLEAPVSPSEAIPIVTASPVAQPTPESAAPLPDGIAPSGNPIIPPPPAPAPPPKVTVKTQIKETWYIMLERIAEHMVDEAKIIYKAYSFWAFVVLGELGDINDALISMGLYTAAQTPGYFNKALKIIAAYGIIVKLVKQKSMQMKNGN